MKNDHFLKIEPYECFYKNDHFSLNFTSHFLDPFSSSAKTNIGYVPTVTATSQQLSMPPKPKKTAASKPQPTTSADLAPKRARKPSSKVTQSAPLDSSDEEDATSQLPPASSKVRRMMRISWTTARTERLLDWLEENPADRQKLFSDSTKDAKEEGRRKRVAKGTKSEFHKSIAQFVFSVDADKGVRDDFAVNGGNYTKSVDNYLGRYAFHFFSFQLMLISLLLQVAKGVSIIQ